MWVQYGGAAVHINVDRVKKREVIGFLRKNRWCFKCRKRLRHFKVYIEWASLWYGPEVHIECSGCGGDHRRMW